MQTIAIIEDDISIQEMYKMKLELEGFRVVVATNGVDGLKIIKENNPDLVLLDLKMPEMTGDEMLLKLREESWGEHIKVIILTNISRDEAPITLRKLNIQQYIVKALYTPQQVLQVVKKYI